MCNTTTNATVTSPTPGCPTGAAPITVTNTNNQVIQAQIGQLFRQSTVAANRLAYAGNIIPNSEFDPAARAFLALLPLPNLPGAQRNYLVNSSDDVNTNQGTLRVDHNFTDNSRMYARYSLRKGTDATFTVDASEILPGMLNPRETLTSNKDFTVKKWRVAVPATADKTHHEIKDGRRIDFFSGREGTLAVTMKSDWQTNPEILATGDSRLGKGVLGAIPLHLIYESTDLQIKKGQKLTWEINLELLK